MNRDLLYHHHRLSHQQIDDFLGQKSNDILLAEKLDLMGQVRDFLFITDALKKAQVNCIPLKGPLLSFRIYGDAACRRSKDIDLLIEFGELEQAISILKTLGFKPQFYDWPADAAFKQFKEQLRNQFHLIHPGKKTAVELHWKLFHFLPLKAAAVENLVKANLVSLQFAGRTFSVLNPEMELLYLVIHGGLHTWRRLKWLVDVHEIAARKCYDEHLFVELVKRVRAERMVAVCNELLTIIYPGKATLPQMGKADQFMVKHALGRLKKDSEAEYDSLKESIRYFSFVIKAFPGARFKMYMVSYLFNSMLDAGDKRRSVWSVFGSFLHPLKFIKNRYHVE